MKCLNGKQLGKPSGMQRLDHRKISNGRSELDSVSIVLKERKQRKILSMAFYFSHL
jgi:hypothetical protein